MRAFKRAFARRRRHPDPPSTPDAFPRPQQRPPRRYMRLPTIASPMAFPSRRNSHRSTSLRGNGRSRPDASLPSNDLGNSALSLPVEHPAEPLLHAPTAPAPIFYDMYQSPAPSSQDHDLSLEFHSHMPSRQPSHMDTDEQLNFPQPHSGLDDPETVRLDIATPSTQIPHPHRTLLVDPYYRPKSQSPGSTQKRIVAAQALLNRRLPQESTRAVDQRVPEYSDDMRHLNRARERGHEHHRDLALDYREVSRQYSEDEYSRITSEEDPQSTPEIDAKEHITLQSLQLKNFPSHTEMLPDHQHSREQPPRSSQKTRTTEGSPYVDHPPRRSSIASTGASAEARVYEAYSETVQKKSRGQSGSGLLTIVELLRGAEGNPVVIEKAALIIGILSEKDPASRDAFGKFSAVQALIQCLSMRISAKFDRTLIVKTVTYALACLLQDSPRNLRLFEMFDGPYKMGKAAASERYENVPEIPRNALRALSELKYNPQSSEGSTNHVLTNSSTTSRTIMYVLRSMAVHEYRAEIQECGLDALRTLLARSGRGTINSNILKQSAQTAATAYKMHRESREVQWQCLTLFCDLDALRPGIFSLRLDVEAFFGTLRAVILTAIDETDEERKGELKMELDSLLKRAVEVAGNIGWRSRSFTEEVVEAGGVETMLNALEFFGDDSEMSDKICSTLRVLLKSDEGRFRMNRVKSACAILDGIASSNAKAAVTLS